MQLLGPGRAAEPSPRALEISTTDLEQTKEKQFHPEFKYTKGPQQISKVRSCSLWQLGKMARPGGEVFP